MAESRMVTYDVSRRRAYGLRGPARVVEASRPFGCDCATQLHARDGDPTACGSASAEMIAMDVAGPVDKLLAAAAEIIDNARLTARSG